VLAGFETTISADAQPEAPKLPGASGFSAATRRWYRTWCESPQAVTFTVTDWQRLHMLAHLVERYFQSPSKDVLAEIRLNESLLGATHVDRLKARIKIERPAVSESAPVPEGVTDLATERKRRLLDDAA
jgi:hypothetical protein